MVLVKFTRWVLEEILNQAEEEWYSPQVIQQELLHLQNQLENQEITDEEYQEQEFALVERLLEGRKLRDES